MKLTRIEVKNFRSFAASDIRLTDGMNALVGPNNCGKSNLVRAIRMALDPEYPFDPVADVPGQRKFAFPRTTLTFDCRGTTSSESTLLRYLRDYEKTVSTSSSSTYADDGAVRFVVTYRGGRENVARQEYFSARGGGDRRGNPELNEKALRQFRKVMRFIAVDSGQSIEELLAGRFREILHTVLKEELKQHLHDAELARKDYVGKLESQLLSPMRDRTLAISQRLFPEVKAMSLTPTVSVLEETLSNVEIRLVDSVETELRNKGTGVAGAILVALLRYLTEASKQSMVLAVEEPEAFLHPAAQERLREDLEALAEQDNVSLLLTTHSPYILSRHPKAQVVAIEKLSDGVSTVCGTARGSEPHSPALSGLFRDLAVPRLLDRYNTIPANSRGILLVEGVSDEAFIRIAAEKLSRRATIEDVHILPNSGTDSLVLQAVLLRAETNQPIWMLLDSDENGRHARDLLTKRFKVKPKDVLEYGRLLGGQYRDDAEAEWLFPAKTMEKFIKKHGESQVLKSKLKRYGEFRYDFTPEGKEAFPEWLRRNAKQPDVAGWRLVFDAIQERLDNSAI
jgi:putative ATP-dependent endonuclease of the OLD family